jgi:hypothetical protein
MVPTRPVFIFIFIYWYKNFTYHRAHTSWIFFFHFVYFSRQTFVKNAQSQVSKREMLKKRNVGGKKRDLVGVHKERDVVLLCLAHILKSQYPGTFTALVSTRVHQKPVP